MNPALAFREAGATSAERARLAVVVGITALAVIALPMLLVNLLAR